ncbi:MAG TPA: undecaprenyl-diphosphate phosphatase, partial [Nitrospira sp.]|nr:undecaprenyl-diphosphate phosphatase [Nitrospira sp.]
MMNWGPELAIILGIIEGLTEFLPVSSTGHLILVGHALGFTGDIASNVEISIQLGSILAIIAYERTKLASLASHAFREQRDFRSLVAARGNASWATLIQQSIQAQPNLWFVIGLGLAFLPAALVGFLAHKSIKTYLFSPTTVAISLIVGGIIILVVERMRDRVRVKELLQVTPRLA